LTDLLHMVQLNGVSFTWQSHYR